MDFLSDSNTMGKNVGDDIAEGKPTLPLIHALQKTTPKNKEILVNAIKKGSISEITKIIDIIKNSNSISYTQEIALQEANKAKLALEFIPESEYKKALIALCDISVQRLT
jgi:octaprenyl-diphosphate synthase